jgi:hypothetical protein
MNNIFVLPQSEPATPRLGHPPMIAPAKGLKPYIATASDGRRYRVTPSGARTFRPHPKATPQTCVTFSYRRIDTDGKPLQRIRMSKKNRLRLRRMEASLNQA